jgi:hypothetical protein
LCVYDDNRTDMGGKIAKLVAGDDDVQDLHEDSGKNTS